MSSGIPSRRYYIKLHWFRPCVPEGYLFASAEFFVVSAALYLSKLIQVLSMYQLNGTQSLLIAEDALLTL